MSSSIPPLISIIMAVYNGEKYIAEAIQSVQVQTFKDYELLIVDDGSRDGTAQIVSTFLSDNRIKYIFQTNAGPGVARNNGIKNSTGEYIAFIDHDDLFYPEKIEKTVRFLNDQPGYGMVYSDMIRIDANGKFISGWFERMKHYGEGDIYFNLLNECFFNHTGTVIRKSVLLEVGQFSEDIRSIEDLDLWLRIARKSKVGLINEPLVKWRQHSSNSSKNLRVNTADTAMVFERQLLLDLKKNEKAVVFRTLSEMYFDLGLMKLSDGLLCDAQVMFRKSLVYGFRFKAVLFVVILIMRIFDPMLSKRFRGKY